MPGTICQRIRVTGVVQLLRPVARAYERGVGAPSGHDQIP